ncbi:MAG: polyribonucleotide nucleotidyltransferase [Candidatus Omnitrophica bacterium]|nr:polyribonucleotide nucleotidyltransferase [Candidatus Omnitrophota bacterium]
MIEKIEIKLSDDPIVFESGQLAKQANASVKVTCGGTVVLVTAVMSKEAKENIDFLPLTVEYKEKTYAAGKIPGGFFKREGRSSEKEILTARLIDRPLRPLFPKGFHNEIQIFAMVLSCDGVNDPDILALVGSSAALTISDIPFAGPIGAVKIGRINNQFIVNPTFEQVKESDLEIVIAGSKNGINMIESGAYQVSEEVMLEAMEFGYEKLLGLIDVQEQFAKKCGKPKAQIEFKQTPTGLYEKVKELSLTRLNEVYQIGSKEERIEQLSIIASDLDEALVSDDSDYNGMDVAAMLGKVEKEQVRKMILKNKKRVDGRGYTDIRPITSEVSALPQTHGSAIFTRGQTQSLAVATLGTSADEQRIDALVGESTKTFMLHYNFPSFSVGEVRPIRGPGRREIGHGALAERALAPVMPSKEKFPYTVRLVSEILESNGSSSMATVCAGTLALMDAGVPILKPVSGIAMGLIKEGDDVAVLTDILGLEDHLGDMDFKVTGTRDGVTAIQLDSKIEGINIEILKKALAQAKQARLFILDKIEETLAVPRADISKFAPRITVITVPKDKIKDIIGPGGKIIKQIVADTGVKIDIDDDGRVSIASADSKASQRAIDIVKGLIAEPEVGQVYEGKITRLMNFGAFCEILPNKEGLIHVSELADSFVKNVEDVIKVGDIVKVKVIEIDKMKRINLSVKQAMPKKDNSDKSE